MKGKYHIEIISNKLRYELEVKRNITIIRGESATGKTRLISMISDYNNYGSDSGVNISCDCECIVVAGQRWKETIESIHNSIIFIDEGNHFILSEDFAKVVEGNSNYFVLITREKISNLPYSVNEIYGLRESRKYGKIKQIFNESYNIYPDIGKSGTIKPDLIITEDSKCGHEFFEKAVENTKIRCVSAGGKTRVLNKMIEKNKEGITLLAIVDGAAFGAEMNEVMNYMTFNDNVVLYTPESFEWLILKAGILNVPSDTLANTYNYAESEKYFSWERYYTDLLRKITNRTQYHYSKESLNPSFLSARNIRKILKSMEKIALVL